ncbi:FlgO family outer membrane protein [Candidatus Latescibacterota bacterium]
MAKLKMGAFVGIMLLLVATAQAQDEESRIALADFQNQTGDASYDQYAAGLSEAIGTFIAQSGMVQLVERNRLQDAINEQLLAQTGFLDEDSAAEVGRLVGARAMILGSFLLEGNVFQVNARMIDTETGQVLTAEQARNTELLEAADMVAVGLLGQLGIEVIETKKSAYKRIGRWVFLGIGAGAGLGAYSAKTQGDDAYDRYLNSVIEEEITKNYNEAQDKDSQKNTFIGLSAGSMLTAAYLYLSSRQPDRIYRRVDAEEASVTWGLRMDRSGRPLLAISRRF